MLEPILQSLREVDGVQGAMIVDPTASVIAHRAHNIYDITVLQQVARAVVNTIDSVQLVQDDWDVLTAHFGEGKLLLRSLRTAGARPRKFVLAVIADGTLNVAFLGVALRVAAAKLITELEAGPTPAPSSSGPIPRPMRNTGQLIAEASRPPSLANTGHSWSQVSQAGPQVSQVGQVGSTSSVSSSDVAVTDTASSGFLTACTKALAVSVGPMAKLFVREAVRNVCGDRPFSRADGPALLAHLAARIDDRDDRAAFQRATRSL